MNKNCVVIDSETESLLNRYAAAFYRKYRISLHRMGADGDDVRQQIRLEYWSAQCQTDQPHQSKSMLFARLMDWLRRELHTRATSHRRVAFDEVMLEKLGYEQEYDAPMQRKELQDLMQRADARTAFVIKKVLEHYTLKEIGTMIGVNESRVSQIRSKFVSFSRKALQVTATICAMVVLSYAQAFPYEGQNYLVSADAPLRLFAKSFPAGTVTLGGNRDGGEGNSMYSVIILPEGGDSASTVNISNLTVASGKSYTVGSKLLDGELVYIDRDFTFTSIPPEVQGAQYIRTANDDKKSTGAAFLSFDVNKPVTVYVAYDLRINPPPSWFADFTEVRKEQNITACHSLEWDPPAQATDLAGYFIYVSKDGAEQHKVEVPYSQTSIPCESLGLTEGGVYVVSATAFNSLGNESDHSNQLTLNWPIGDTEPDPITPGSPKALCFDVSIGDTRMKICQKMGS